MITLGIQVWERRRGDDRLEDGEGIEVSEILVWWKTCAVGFSSDYRHTQTYTPNYTRPGISKKEINLDMY